jgi:hypothetical protein
MDRSAAFTALIAAVTLAAVALAVPFNRAAPTPDTMVLDGAARALVKRAMLLPEAAGARYAVIWHVQPGDVIVSAQIDSLDECVLTIHGAAESWFSSGRSLGAVCAAGETPLAWWITARGAVMSGKLDYAGQTESFPAIATAPELRGTLP